MAVYGPSTVKVNNQTSGTIKTTSSTVTVSWSGASSTSSSDPICLYRVSSFVSSNGSSFDSSYSQQKSVASTATSGSCTMNAPAAGQYMKYAVFTETDWDYADNVYSNVIVYRLNYSRCTSPTTIKINGGTSAIETSDETVIVTCSGAKAGNDLSISAYYVQYQDSADGVTWPSTWTSLTNMTTSQATSGYSAATPEAGMYRRFQIKTKASVSGYDASSWTTSPIVYKGGISACIPPREFKVLNELSKASTDLMWSGEESGSQNTITAYHIQCQDCADGTSWPSTWIDLETDWHASPLEVSPPDTVGHYRRFRIQVKGSAGADYYSDWLISSNILRKDMAPFEGFTDPEPIALSTKIKAIHMTEMQNRINELLLFNGKESFSFTPIIAGQTRLTGWTEHISELRSAIDRYNSLHDEWLEIQENRPRADVVQQLRNIMTGTPYQNAKRYGYRREKANPDPSARITYLYDAADMTPMSVNLTTGEPSYGSWQEFIDEVCRPVMLKYDGTVDYELDHDDQTKKLDGSASDVADTSYSGNAMVEFRKYKWVHRSEDSQYEYVVFSDVQWDDTYHAYAHINENGDVKDAFYWGMFESIKSNGLLRSISSIAPSVSQTASNEIAQSQANGSGWNIIYKSGWDYICDLLTMLSKTDNAQVAFGAGRTKSTNTSALKTGTLVSSPAFCGYSDGTSDVKVLYIESLWGNLRERMAGLIMNKTNGMLVKMTPPYNTTGDGYEAAHAITGTTDTFITGTHCSDKLGNLPMSLGGSESTYICDKAWYNTSGVYCAVIGGGWKFATDCGPRSVNLSVLPTATATNSGSRLSYLAP